MIISSLGIIDLWYKHVEFAIKTKKRYKRFEASSNGAKAFRLVDMQTSFYILFIGLVISTFVFISELVRNKRETYVPFEFVH